MQYSEVQPVRPLRHMLRCIWSLRSSLPIGPAALERITPDGCAEIILNRADPFRRVSAGGELRTQPPVLAVGQISAPIELLPTGAIDIVALRFEPGGMHELMAIPMHELTDRDVSLHQIDRNLFSQLEAAVHAHPRSRAISKLQDVLLGRQLALPKQTLRKRARADARMLGQAIALMRKRPSQAASVAQTMGLTRRTLERMFRTGIGLSPKRFLRIERMQALLLRLESNPHAPNWSDLALTFGFSDQSHMIRDFRLLAGTTPSQYLLERGDMAAHFPSKPA